MKSRFPALKSLFNGWCNLKMCLHCFTDTIKAAVYVNLPLQHLIFILNVLKVSHEYNSDFSLYHGGDLRVLLPVQCSLQSHAIKQTGKFD
jgi:hypothetical protein